MGENLRPLSQVVSTLEFIDIFTVMKLKYIHYETWIFVRLSNLFIVIHMVNTKISIFNHMDIFNYDAVLHFIKLNRFLQQEPCKW